MSTISYVSSFSVGMLTGAVYFLLLWRSARSLSGGGKGPAVLFGGFGVRFFVVLTVMAAAIALDVGAGAFVAGLVGFMGSRLIATRLAAPRSKHGALSASGRFHHGD